MKSFLTRGRIPTADDRFAPPAPFGFRRSLRRRLRRRRVAPHQIGLADLIVKKTAAQRRADFEARNRGDASLLAGKTFARVDLRRSSRRSRALDKILGEKYGIGSRSVEDGLAELDDLMHRGGG